MSRGKEKMYKITDRMIVKTGIAAVLLCLIFGTLYKLEDRRIEPENNRFKISAEISEAGRGV